MPAGSLIGAVGLVGLGQRARRGRLFRGLDGARRRHGGLALRSGFRHARPHLRRAGARADHDADARRRLCLDRELAGDAIFARSGRLARHLSGLCRIAGFGRRAVARLRAAAPIAPRRASADAAGSRAQARRPYVPAHGLAFVLVAAGFAVLRLRALGVVGAASRHFQTIRAGAGHRGRDRHAVRPAQVLARICELAFARRLHPLWVARFAVGLLVAAFALLALLPFSAASAAAFAVMYGMANGLLTIARGTVPLALFGAAGYGRLVGRIGGPFLVVQAVAPVVADLCRRARLRRGGPGAGRGASPSPRLICFVVIRRPR